MHETSLIKKLPKKGLKEVIELSKNIFIENYLKPRLREKSKEKEQASTLPEIQKLYLDAERLKGELDILKAEIEALPYIKGTIRERKVKDPNNSLKIRYYHSLRWYEDGIPKEKHITKRKKKDSDLLLEEAQRLINNSERASLIEQQIKDKSKKLKLIENRLISLKGKNVEISLNSKSIPHGFITGRDDELIKLQSNLVNRIHTLIVGEPGIGKSLLLRTLIETIDQKHIYIDNLRATKNTLVDSVIRKLHEDNELNIDSDRFSSGMDFEELKKLLKGKPISEIADLIRDSLINKDYFIAIDSLASLTQANKTVIEKLFEAQIPLIACTNQIKNSVEFESLYRKFHKLELKPLSNKEVEEMLNQKLQNIKADNWIGLLKSRIINAASGNPGIVDKMVKDAYALSTGGELTENQIRSIQVPDLHRRYFDLTPFLVLGIACFAILRFIGIGTNDTLLYVFGGSAFVILLALSRLMNRGFKR